MSRPRISLADLMLLVCVAGVMFAFYRDREMGVLYLAWTVWGITVWHFIRIVVLRGTGSLEKEELSTDRNRVLMVCVVLLSSAAALIVTACVWKRLS